MKTVDIVWKSILSGIAPSDALGSEGSYDIGIGVDPDFPLDDSSVRPSGILRPTVMTKFSGATMDQTPLWITANPKTTVIYVYGNAGDFYSYNSSLASETLVSATATSVGNGMAYYDNHIYLRKSTEISRYGPLNGAAAMTATYWTVTLSLTAPTNTTYPSINGQAIPNGHMHRHTDDKLYFCDVTSGNQGILSYIRTSKSSVEGDTNNVSTYNALDFDHGIYPVCIETYGTDLAVALIEGTDTTIRQRRAKIAFWDTTNASFQKIHEEEFPDPLITAMKNVNGVLYVWSGSASGGCRLSRFIGGYTYEQVFYNPDIFPPFQGAVDHMMNRVIWGSSVTYPSAYAVVFAYGSNVGFGNGVHGILKATTTNGTTPLIGALKYIQNSALPRIAPIVGWKDSGGVGLDKLTTGGGTSVIRLQREKLGRPARGVSLEIPLADAITTNHTITVKLLTDSGDTTYTLGTINNTNYANSQRKVTFMLAGMLLRNDVQLELTFSGSALLSVDIPITLKIEPY
jgi:hypothetical protein